MTERNSKDCKLRHPTAVFRMMVLEYEVLRELGREPMALGMVAPTVLRSIEILVSNDLARMAGHEVAITTRGRQVLAVELLNRTRFTVAFDYVALGR